MRWQSGSNIVSECFKCLQRNSGETGKRVQVGQGETREDAGEEPVSELRQPGFDFGQVYWPLHSLYPRFYLWFCSFWPFGGERGPVNRQN